MGLRCLLGHDFGPPEMEREREENGDEMVVTVREVETCRRCGEERVVSENKEVTAIRSPDEVSLDDDEAADADAPSGPAEPEPRTTGTADAGSTGTPDDVDIPGDDADDGVILDEEEEAERGHGEWPDADGVTATESAGRVDTAAEAISDATASDGSTSEANESAESTDVADVAAEEGAELIDADDGDAEGEVSEERPDAARSTESTGGTESWPEHEETDEGFDASQATGGGPADVSFGGGLTPDAAESTTERGRGEYVGADETGADEFEDIVRVESDADEDADVTEFFCPNCGLSERAGETSMRVGDICPSCHKGYVAERNA